MYKKLMCVVISALLLMLTGCKGTKQIDKASIAETVTVDENTYTFYLLSGEDAPQGVSVDAVSFEEACNLAKKKYIPNLSLSKLELLIINEKIYKDVLEKDIEYISEQPEFSPLMYVTLSDKNTIELISKDKKVPTLIEEQIIQLKNNNDDVNTNSLSIFNNFSSSLNDEFSVSYINSNKEIKAEKIEISVKK